jgi:hypothetical protein
MRRPIITAAGVGLVLRLAFAFGYWVDKPLTRDEVEYLSLARSIAHGDGVTYDAALLDRYARTDRSIVPFGRAPGYPTFLALVGGGSHVTSTVPGPVKAAQSLMGACTVVLLGLFAGRLAGRRAAVAAAWMAAIYPPLIWTCSYALSEPLYVPAGLATAWLFDSIGPPGPRGRTARAIVCGAVAGVGLLIRAATLLFLPFAVLWLVLRRQFAAAVGLAIGAAIVVLPWTVRNVHVYHRVVLVASDGGVTFWTGNNAFARGEGDLAANPDLGRVHDQLRSSHAALTEEEMEPIYYRESLTWMRQHPLAWIALEARKAFYTVVPTGPSYRLHSRLYYGASLASYLALLPLAIAGFIRLPDRCGRAGLWLLAASSVAVCLVFFPQERFRLAIIDPALIVWAAALAAPRRGTTPA